MTVTESDLMTPDDAYWFENTAQPWPEWLTAGAGFRPWQLDAHAEIMEHYYEGADVVILDAPTGAGKTLIAEMVRRTLAENQGRAIYVCDSLGLMDQFKKSFPYANPLKGRTNYSTLNMPFPTYTAGDCDRRQVEDKMEFRCSWCTNTELCPYQAAKRVASASPIPVTNTAYLVSETNRGRGDLIRKRDLVIVDEADTLESILMGQVSLEISERMVNRLGILPPKKGTHLTTHQTWLGTTVPRAVNDRLKQLVGKDDLKSIREVKELERLQRRLFNFRLVDNDNGIEWVRDNSGPAIWKPVRVSSFGESMLWSRAPRWLLMSASVVSSQEMIDSLGLDGRDVRTVSMGSPFPVDNRRICVAPIASVTSKDREESWPKIARALKRLVEEGDANHQRILVHAVSYQFTEFLISQLLMTLKDGGRDLFRYQHSGEKDIAVEGWLRSKNGIMIAPSLDRGWDFPDDACRIQVIAKVPFPYLGDPQIAARLNSPGGQRWYTTQAIRSMIQMSGRAVRSETDHAATYVLDAAFVDIVKKNKSLLPAWWADAIDMNYDSRWLRR